MTFGGDLAVVVSMLWIFTDYTAVVDCTILVDGIDVFASTVFTDNIVVIVTMVTAGIC